jgi:hypothetical protein
VRFEQLLEVAPRQGGKETVVLRPRLRGARRVVDEREFAEDHARLEHGEPARFRLPLAADQHAAAEHDVDRLPFVAFVENDLAPDVAPVVQETVDDAQFAAREGREERQLPQRGQPRRILPCLQEPDHVRRSRAG